MDATYIKNSIAQLKTDIFMHVRHRSLQTHTGEPIVNVNQLFFLLLPFFNDENWTDEHYEAAITTIIISAALSAHDEIKEHDATSQEQQLKVLAGDYYSGRYYEILAHSGNIKLIRMLSQGVIKRCEYQTQVYERSNNTVEDWLNTLMVIESELTEQMYRLYHFEHYIPILQKGLLMYRLHDELNMLKHKNQTSLMQMMITAASKQYPSMTLDEVLQNKVKQLLLELEDLLKQVPIKNEIKQILLSNSPLKI